MREDVYRTIAGAIYAAALDPARWGGVLDAIGHHLDGARLHLFGYDLDSGLHLGALASGHDPASIRDWCAHYGRLNPYPAAAARKGAPPVVRIEALVAPEDVRRTEYYAGFLAPEGRITSGTGAFLDVSANAMFVMGTLHPERRAEALDAAALPLVSELAPALRAGCRLSRLVASAAVEARVLGETGGCGLLALSLAGRLRHASPVAAALLEEGEPLRLLPDGSVAFSDPRAEAVATALRRALARGDRARPNTVGPFRGGWSVDLLPVPAGEAQAAVLAVLGDPSLLVVLRRSPAPPPAAAAHLRAHGLTEAETAVAMALAEGLTPARIAERRRVSLHTVRNQIKAALSKCGLTRQSQLAALAAGAGRNA